MSDTRKEFLLKVAKGVAYSAPAIHTLSAPDGLLGQGHDETTTKGGMGVMGDMDDPDGKLVSPTRQELGTPSRPAPWERRPPGGGGGG